MKTALIITTYNWPEALNLSLSSIAQQSVIPNQVVIADDGSDEQTKAIIDRWRESLPIIHEWQNDAGFRAARSRNTALRKVDSEYVICIDGDMVLHPEFVADHINFSKSDTFVQGSRVLLNDTLSQKLMAIPREWR